MMNTELTASPSTTASTSAESPLLQSAHTIRTESFRQNRAKAKIISLKVASYLTEPVCRVRENYYSFYVLDKLCYSTQETILKILSLVLGIMVFPFVSLVTVPLGIAIRGLARKLSSKPFVYVERSKEGKTLPEDKKITLLSHNECYMPGGYTITDGQVSPPSDKKRIDENVRQNLQLNPDIITLYEVPDICDADYITKKLEDYPFVIPVAGIRAVGPNSMLYVASKYKIIEPSIEFIPFIKNVELTGRSKSSEKGFLSFDIISHGDEKPFATVVTTHLQHSEIPSKPEDDEESRAAQMSKITKHLKSKIQLGHNIIFTGDLNQEEAELHAFFTNNKVDWLIRDDSIQGMPTWGGDEWCAKLMGKPASDPLVLDYTFIAGKAKEISSRIIETGYTSSEFRPEATSDHYRLFSKISCG